MDTTNWKLQHRCKKTTPHARNHAWLLSSVVIDREIGNWDRFKNRRRVSSYTGLCPGEYSSGNTRGQSCVTKHGNPRLRAALVETAWRLVRFQPEYRAVKKMETPAGKRRTSDRRSAQESDRGGGPAVGGGPVAHPHWSGCDRDIGINQLVVRGEQ